MNHLSETKKETYVAFEIEKKSINEISVARGLVDATLGGHLADALLIGLPVDLYRLNITKDLIDFVEDKIRKPPINSSIKFYFTVVYFNKQK